MQKVYRDPGGDIYGVWIVKETGALLYLRVPIKVICIDTVGDFRNGITYYVEAIIGLVDGTIIFFIFNKPVKHSYFKIKGVNETG